MGIIFAIVTAFAFAFSNIFIKRGMETSSKDNGFFMTVFLNVLILGLVALFYRLFVSQVSISINGVILFGLSGIFTTFLGRITLFKSFREIGPSRGAAIKNSAPLFTILFAVIFLQEVLHLYPLIGVLFVLFGLGIQGYYLLKQERLPTNHKSSNYKKGYFLALLSAFVFGIGQAIRKPGMQEMPDPFFGAFISSVVALIIILLFEWKKGTVVKTIRNQYKNRNYNYYLSGVLTSVAILSFFIGITYTQVSYVAAIAAVEPLLTIILSKILLRNQEAITRYTVYSASAVFCGVITIILFNS
ncbi:DMT family transporter [Bacillus pinisoli]|uniref:DMT family transporter n=1 Tax=Bacillus pinisoli TaxID=2901866 RepID=UPI001FF6F89D|nr:EamA family transporter [Bacillus pinisoli]